MQGLFLTSPNLSVSGALSKHDSARKCWVSDVSPFLWIWEFCSRSSCIVMCAHTKNHLRSSRPVWWGQKWMTGAKETGQSLELKLQKTHTCSFVQTRTQNHTLIKTYTRTHTCTPKDILLHTSPVKPLRSTHIVICNVKREGDVIHKTPLKIAVRNHIRFFHDNILSITDFSCRQHHRLRAEREKTDICDRTSQCQRIWLSTTRYTHTHSYKIITSDV